MTEAQVVEVLKLRGGEARLSGGWVVVGDRVVPALIEVHFPGGAEVPEPALDFTIEVVDGVPMVTRLELVRRPGRPGVRGDSLRRIQLDAWVEDIVALASAQVVARDDEGNVAVDRVSNADAERRARGDVRRMMARGRRTITDDHLARVAAVYREHQDHKPAQAVQDAFGASQRTAFRWIAAAREAGVL